MKHLFLEPLDVWLFRDGRPFDARSDHRAETLFPPYPSVVAGAIRSHHLVLAGVDLEDRRAVEQAVGTADALRGIRLRGPFVARRRRGSTECFFPQPADSVVVQGESVRLRAASPPQTPPPHIRAGTRTPALLGLKDLPTKARDGLWLSQESLIRYLYGEVVEATEGGTLFCRESRPGIAINADPRTVQEGALYEVEFVRPQFGTGLLVEADGLTDWPMSGILRIGGEGRGAPFEFVEAVPWPDPPDPLPARFKVYFATPTFFAAGWAPHDWNAFFDGDVKLVAAAVNRYESIGGYDYARREHKPARRYVPAGSQYYFEVHGMARLRPDLLQGAVTEFGGDMGFGQILITRWERFDV